MAIYTRFGSEVYVTVAINEKGIIGIVYRDKESNKKVFNIHQNDGIKNINDKFLDPMNVDKEYIVKSFVSKDENGYTLYDCELFAWYVNINELKADNGLNEIMNASDDLSVVEEIKNIVKDARTIESIIGLGVGSMEHFIINMINDKRELLSVSKPEYYQSLVSHITGIMSHSKDKLSQRDITAIFNLINLGYSVSELYTELPDLNKVEFLNSFILTSIMRVHGLRWNETFKTWM